MTFEDLSPLAAKYVYEIIRTRAYEPDGDPDENGPYEAWGQIEGDDFHERSLIEIEDDCQKFLASTAKACGGKLPPLDIDFLASAFWEFRGGNGLNETVFDPDDLQLNAILLSAASSVGAAEAGVLPGSVASHQRRER